MNGDINDIDYIETDRETMLNFHGKYVFLFDKDHLDLFETEQIRDLPYHPISGKPFDTHISKYIELHGECYDLGMALDLSTLLKFFDWYDKSRRKGSTVEDLRKNSVGNYNIVRYYLTATDFQSHFKNFNPLDSDQERYERDLAEKALYDQGYVGTWLIRHSSYNRPTNKTLEEQNKRHGIRYYAISFIGKKFNINHVLLEHRVGFGWRHERIWYPCFLDCLEAILEKYNIPYSRRVGQYVSNEED